MSKRSLSPNPLPPAKRIHITDSHSIPSKSPFSFNDSLYDELILCIFSHLSWFDLCAAQATSTNWCRLACDNTLWKNLYLRVFGRSRLRGSRGYVIRADGREVRPLPGRMHIKQEPRKDWKWMFRVSSNWKNGRCAIEELETPEYRSLSPSSCETHVLLAGPLTIVASSLSSEVPKVNISTSATNTFELACESRSNGGPYYISTLAIDQSPPIHEHSRLAVFLSSGEFTTFSINPSQLSASVRSLTFLPSRGRSRVNPVAHAAYHHPLLVTLSTNFTLTLYDLSGDTVVPTQTLTSFTSFPPSSIVLSTTSSTKYKLVLAYTVPVYPEHWSVGVTELIISGSKPPATLTHMLSDTPQWSLDPARVVSTRTTRAIDTPLGFFDDDKLRALHEQYSRKVSYVTGTQTDGKWVVLAPAETPPAGVSSGSSFVSGSSSINTSDVSFLISPTSLQLYRLYLPPTSNSVAAPPPKLSFVRSLHGQVGPIASLALADGRCVSLGLNGRLWVWDLEAGTGAEVSTSSFKEKSQQEFSLPRMVAFDERRIVTTEGSRVYVHRFDI